MTRMLNYGMFKGILWQQLPNYNRYLTLRKLVLAQVPCMALDNLCKQITLVILIQISLQFIGMYDS
jgi:hypothetical protein